MKTLKGINSWRLYIKDDFSSDKRGNYLAEDETETLVINLINMVVRQKGIKSLFFIGSSKGGYEALNFSFHFPMVTVVAGAPQYYLADYLKSVGAIPCLTDIVGKTPSMQDLEILNKRLKYKILHSEIVPRAIYLHYSSKEHTYTEHIKDLIADLLQRNVELHEDVRDYPAHSDLVSYYPNYLKQTINELIAK